LGLSREIGEKRVEISARNYGDLSTDRALIPKRHKRFVLAWKLHSTHLALLLRDVEVAFFIVVSPGARHRVAVYFSIDDVVYDPSAVAFGIEFHRDGSCFGGE
jgi:hypothetical protein